MSIFLPVFLGLVLILFLVAICISARTWRWHQMSLVVMNFFAIITLMVLSVMALGGHEYWGGLLNKTNAEIKKEEGLIAKTQADIDQKEKLIRDIVTERGRIWTNCIPENANLAARTVQVVIEAPEVQIEDLDDTADEDTADEDADEDAADEGEDTEAEPVVKAGPVFFDEIEPGQLSVFVFQQEEVIDDADTSAEDEDADTDDEDTDSEDDEDFDTEDEVDVAPTKNITKYLGRFLVTNVSADKRTVTLKLSTIEDSFWKENITPEEREGVKITWVLYDRMPIAGLEVFVHNDGSKMSEEEIKELLPKQSDFPGTGDQQKKAYDIYIANFLKDQKKISELTDEEKKHLVNPSKLSELTDAERKHFFTPLELAKWAKELKVDKVPEEQIAQRKKELVQLASLNRVKVLCTMRETYDFDLPGSTEEKPIEVKRIAGDNIWLDLDTAKRLAGEDRLEYDEDSAIYSHAIKDYDLRFTGMAAEYKFLVDAIAAYQKNTNLTIEKTNSVKAENRKSAAHAELAKADQTKHIKDYNTAVAFNKALVEKRAELEKLLIDTMMRNLAMERQLTAKQFEVLQKVRSRIKNSNATKPQKKTATK